MKAGFAKLLAVVVLPCVMVAGCGGSDGGGPSPTPEQSPSADASPPPYGTKETASDSGSAVVVESGFTMLGETRAGGDSFAVWAAVVENTSRTDLLAYVSLELRWQNDAGEVVSVYDGLPIEEQRAYDVLPGKTAAVGGGMLIDDIVPNSHEIVVHDQEWYPIWALDTRGIPVGVEVTNFTIDSSNFDSGGLVRGDGPIPVIARSRAGVVRR